MLIEAPHFDLASLAIHVMADKKIMSPPLLQIYIMIHNHEISVISKTV